MAVGKKKERIPAPGSKGEKSTLFYTRKKWRNVLQYNKLELAGRNLGARGTLVVGTALMKNHYVTRLDLAHNFLGDEGAVVMADVLRGNGFIQYLNLAYNEITDIGGIALASAFIPNVSPSGQPGQWNRTLFTVILMGNAMGDDTLLAFSNAAACSRDLNCVDLSWNNVGPQGTKCLLRSFQRNPLCNFILAANHIGDEGVIHLCEALHRYGGKSQTTLNLFRNDLSHRGAEAIGKLLAQNDSILEVNLCGNTLGLRGAQELRRYLSSADCVLRTLNLADNLLGDEGAVEMAALIRGNLPTLQRLDLSDNKFTDKGATAVAQALKENTALQLVICQDNTFGPKAVAAVEILIRATKTLKSLNLSHCIESSDSRRALTLAVGEADGVHVEMGVQPEADENKDICSHMTEFLRQKADQEAQKEKESASVKKGKKAKRRISEASS